MNFVEFYNIQERRSATHYVLKAMMCTKSLLSHLIARLKDYSVYVAPSSVALELLNVMRSLLAKHSMQCLKRPLGFRLPKKREPLKKNGAVF